MGELSACSFAPALSSPVGSVRARPYHFTYPPPYTPQVLDDIGLDLDSQLLDAPSTSTAVATTSTADADADGEDDDLQARLDNLRRG